MSIGLSLEQDTIFLEDFQHLLVGLAPPAFSRDAEADQAGRDVPIVNVAAVVSDWTVEFKTMPEAG